jgi:hypothetical protein
MAGESLEAEAEQSGDVANHSELSDVSQSRDRECHGEGGGDSKGKNGAGREEEVEEEGQEEEEEGGEGGGMCEDRRVGGILAGC